MKSFATDIQLIHVVKPSEVLKSLGSLTYLNISRNCQNLFILMLI